MAVKVTWHGTATVVTINNPPVNATSTAVRAGLASAIAQVQTAGRIILRCAGSSFVAGGDISEFDRPPEDPHLPDVVQMIEDSTPPVIALLHGTVLGGGVEIALACAVRIAAPGTRFGLPEINVGVIPGAGGTQRAPRLVGWEASARMACLGEMLSDKEMLDLGGVDAIDADGLAAALAWSEPRPTPVSTRSIAAPDQTWIAETRARITRFAKGRQAPLHAFDALLWASDPFEISQPKERAMHLGLRASHESRALRHMFFAERSVIKPPEIKGQTARALHRVTVVGGGLMGAGITVACLTAGLTVDLAEHSDAAAADAEQRVTALLDRALKRGHLSPADHADHLTRFMAQGDLSSAENADLVVEAIYEDLAAKQSLFGKIEDIAPRSALLATNTSYLDPRQIFDGIVGQDRCLGLHFFSPAQIMKLLEIVRLPTTSDQTLATAFGLARTLRKTPVLSGICDGFIGNRILAAYRRAAEYMLADGALPQDIDTAMRAFGFAMGPFEAQDMSGLMIAHANRRRQDATRPKAERYVTLSDQLCDLGRTGQKAGRGWYRYDAGQRTPQRDPEVTGLIEAYSRDNGLPRQTFTPEDIQTRLLAVMANEGARIVDEGVAASDAAVDVVKVAGYGFPRWHGGPMHWATRQGPDTLRAALDRVDRDSPNSFVRANRYSKGAAR